MFGCDGFFAAGRIYALVWKEGRIGLKLVDRDSYEEAMIMKGSDPWTAGTRTMSNWVLLPGGFESDPSELETWVERAYAQAIRDEDS